MKPYYEDEWVQIYHGDCREILPSLPKVDLVLTDPPYNAGKDYGTYKDNLDASAYNDFMREVITKSQTVSDYIAIYSDSHRFRLFWDILPNASPIFLHIQANGFGNSQNIRQDHHVILTTAKSNESTSSIWNGIRVLREGYFFREVKTGHPCQTSEQAMAKFISLFTQPDSVVLDPFVGSGTTLRAAIDLNRKCIGIEIEEKYCEIAAKRCSQQVFDFTPTNKGETG